MNANPKNTGIFSSLIGKKMLMGLTGLFLISFLLVHCIINALIFLNDGGKTFNEGAEFMGTNPVIRTVEILLFVGILAHIIDALMLTIANRKTRNQPYSYSRPEASSKWYSRWMGLLGTLLLMFLIIHLKHFWVVSRFTDHITSGEETLFEEMKEVFENPVVVLVYMLSMVSLAYHLLHGFQSAFQTMGIRHPKYTPAIQTIGKWFSILIPIIFALMPLSMYMGWIQ